MRLLEITKHKKRTLLKMNNKIFLLTTIGFLFVKTGYAQSCNDLLNSKIDLEAIQVTKVLKKLVNCSNLDLFDLEWCSPYWIQILQQNKSKDYMVTYRVYK